MWERGREGRSVVNIGDKRLCCKGGRGRERARERARER